MTDLETFNVLKKKAKSEQTKTQLLYLIGLNTGPAQKAIEFIERLDKLIAIYITPTGKIGVNGAVDGLMKYQEFHSQ
jgi:hypothetical protein